MSYRDYEQALAPPWLQGTRGAGLLATTGESKDIALDAMQQATLVRLPLYCPPDILLAHGRDRGLPRYTADTDVTYRARLAAAMETWRYAGTARGVIAAMTAMGFVDGSGQPTTRVYGYTSAVPPWWSQWYDQPWPAAPVTNWSRFAVELHAPGPFGWGAARWGDAALTWGPGAVWGFSTALPNLSLVRKVIRTWKSAHETCADLFIMFPDANARPVRLAGEE